MGSASTVSMGREPRGGQVMSELRHDWQTIASQRSAPPAGVKVPLRFGRCVFDRDRWELRCDAEPVALEPRAMRILSELLDGRGNLVTKVDLLDRVWGDRFVSEAALTTQIKALRRAVGDTGRDQSVIKTVHGQGYRFIADVADEDVADEDDRHTTRINARDVETKSDQSTESDIADYVGNPVIAVLPFENLSADQSLAHLGGGLTCDVVTALSKHRWLRVVPRATAAGYEAQPDAVPRLRAELGVDYAIEGTVRVGGDRLRVTVSLADTVSGTCRWVERYNRRFEDLFDVLDEITEVVVATIEAEVGAAERDRVRRGPPPELRAWDLYHLGVAHFFRFTEDDNTEAQRLLGEARRLDPHFAEAHAWWAYAVVLGMTYWDTDPDPDTLTRALAATTTALETDDHNALFHMLRGRVQIARRNYAAALAESQRAVDLNPTLAAAFCGLGDALCYQGRYDEALEHFEHAVELGAHDPQRWAFLSYGALALLFSGRYDEAIRWSERGAAIPNCQYWTTAHRVVSLAHAGRSAETTEAVSELLELCPHFTVDFARRKLFFLTQPEQIELYLDGLTKAGIPEGCSRSPELPHPTTTTSRNETRTVVGMSNSTKPSERSTPVDPEALREEVRAKYREVAETPEATFHFHTGRELARRCGYDMATVDELPDIAVESFAGVANPFQLRGLTVGERVVDIGSGAGFDSFLAAQAVGPTGAVLGVDMTPAMLAKSRRIANGLGSGHVEFREGIAEALPVNDGWADVAISNGVFNLCPDKRAVFDEVFRVLRPGGVLQFADIASGRPVPAEALREIDLWTG